MLGKISRPRAQFPTDTAAELNRPDDTNNSLPQSL